MSDELREAAQNIADRSPYDEDAEGLGGTWCHFCQEQEPKHATWCEWVALRAALAAHRVEPAPTLDVDAFVDSLGGIRSFRIGNDPSVNFGDLMVARETVRRSLRSWLAADTPPSDAPEPDEWDEADNMCPNCITPWKCNGPHLHEQTLAYQRHAPEQGA